MSIDKYVKIDENSKITEIDFFDKIKKINFCGFPRGVLIDAFKFYNISIEGFQNYLFNLDVKEIVNSINFNICYEKLEYKILENGGEILFVFSDEFYREDAIKKIKAVTTTTEKFDFVFPENIEATERTIKEKKRLTRLAYKWYLKCMRVLKQPESLQVVNYLIKAYLSVNKILNLACGKYKLVTFYFDAGGIESIVRNIFKKKRVKTATLQHGMCQQADLNENSKPTISNILITLNKTDFFLAWNELTCLQSKKFGITPNKLITCGPISLIGQKINYEKRSQNLKGIFGIVLDSSQVKNDRSNMEMITIANEFCTTTGLKYYIRLHPTMKKCDYEKHIEKQYFLGYEVTSLDFSDYVEKVDFTILTHSSSICEISYCNGQVFRYLPDWLDDHWKSVPQNTFCDKNQLHEEYTKWVEADCEFDENIKSLLGSTEDISLTYKNAFNKMCKMKGK